MVYKFFFSNDNLILNEYFKLRNRIYKEEFNYDVPVESHDIKSFHLIIQDDNQNVVGGARITPKAPGSLPMEDHGASPFKHTDRSDVCEIGRVVVSKEHRSMHVLTNIFESITQKCREINKKTLLVIGKPQTVRLDSMMCKKINIIPNIIKDVSLRNSFYIDQLGEVNLLVVTIPD